MKELISVVVSCYNEEEVLPIFYKEIDNVSKKMDNVNFELLFVDDGSKDKTLSIIKELAKKENVTEELKANNQLEWVRKDEQY